jgi:hypothetical protein
MGRGNEGGGDDLMWEEERSQRRFVYLTPWCAGGRPVTRGSDRRPAAMLVLQSEVEDTRKCPSG